MEDAQVMVVDDDVTNSRDMAVKSVGSAATHMARKLAVGPMMIRMKLRWIVSLRGGKRTMRVPE